MPERFSAGRIMQKYWVITAQGPNHVLPTSGAARFSSALGVYDFQKRISVISCTPGTADKLARVASVMAREENLTAHARSAECRISS